MQDIASDAGRLIEHQFQLLRSDFTREFDKARKAALSLGAGLVGVSGILGTLTAVHLLHQTTRLPLWGCYGLVGGLLGVAGAGFFGTGLAKAAEVRLIPPQTAEMLREDVGSLKRAVSQAGG
jgi:hypothetical protein